MGLSRQAAPAIHVFMTPMFAAASGAFAFLVTVAAILSAIFWMIVGWRAMRAHERLADAAENLARKFKESDKP
jgi:uncharacterized membrane protein